MIKADLCVIGTNPAGLAIAMGAAALKASVVLVDNGESGAHGVATPEAIAAAFAAAGKAADAVRRAGRFGLRAREPIVEFDRLVAGIKARATLLAASNAPARYTAMGVQLMRASARFVNKGAIEAAGQTVRAAIYVIATNAKPRLPDIPGLASTPFVTPASVLDLPRLPRRLAVIGAGDGMLQLAQAFRRLGSLVDVFGATPPLADWDEELAGIALRALRQDGVVLHPVTEVRRVELMPSEVRLIAADAMGDLPCDVTHLLVSTAGMADVGRLNLPAAGIVATPSGIAVDAVLRCDGNSRVYAVGASAAGAAGEASAHSQAALVLRHALLRTRGPAMPPAPIRAVFTDPELAWVGLSEAQSRAAHGGGINILRLPFAEADRAIADDHGVGLIKVITASDGRILGCGIVGPHAAELIAPWALAASRGLTVADMADLPLPVPSLSELSGRVARLWYMPKLARAGASSLLRLMRWRGW